MPRCVRVNAEATADSIQTTRRLSHCFIIIFITALFSSTMDRKTRILSRSEIRSLIAQGRKVIIVDQKVLRADAWLPYHPGGETSILHLVGRDATDEVHALHSLEAQQRMNAYQIGRIEGRWKNMIPPIQGGIYLDTDDAINQADNETASAVVREPSSAESSAAASPLFEPADSDLRRRNPSGEVNTTSRRQSDTSLSSVSDLDDINSSAPAHIDKYTQKNLDLDHARYPSLDPLTQSEIVDRYRLLNEQIRAAGLYQCQYSAYLVEAFRYCLLFSGFLCCLHYSWFCASALFLGLFWHQLVFTAHDAGHMGITHSFHLDTMIGIFIADFMGGLSIGWWKRNHNVHHIVTNSPEHDPDIEHLPFFAISPRFFEDLRSSYYNRIMPYDAFARFAVRYQHYLYYPVLTLGRFNLYRLSWAYLLGSEAPRKGPAWWHRYLELAGQVFFWTWFGYFVLYRSIPTNGSRLLFLLVSHAITGPLHVQITLSHFAMSTSDLGPSESFPQKMLRTTMDVDCPPWLDFVHGGLQFQAVHHLFPRIPRHNLRQVQKLVMQFCKDVKIPYALYGFIDGNKQVVGRLEEVSRQAKILAQCQKAVAGGGNNSMH